MGWGQQVGGQGAGAREAKAGTQRLFFMPPPSAPPPSPRAGKKAAPAQEEEEAELMAEEPAASEEDEVDAEEERMVRPGGGSWEAGLEDVAWGAQAGRPALLPLGPCSPAHLPPPLPYPTTQNVDWEAHPALCILSETRGGKFVVLREGCDFSQFGLVRLGVVVAGRGSGAKHAAPVGSAHLHPLCTPGPPPTCTLPPCPPSLSLRWTPPRCGSSGWAAPAAPALCRWPCWTSMRPSSAASSERGGWGGRLGAAAAAASGTAGGA